MTHHLKPQEYARLAAQDRAFGSSFVCQSPRREFEGTRPFAEPERPKEQRQKNNVKEGEPA